MVTKNSQSWIIAFAFALAFILLSSTFISYSCAVYGVPIINLKQSEYLERNGRYLEAAASRELAAEFYNLARGKGINGSNTDFLICSLAHAHNMSIFTTDKDFQLYASVLPIKLYEPRVHKKI